MAEQYFTADPTCESKQVPCSFVYRGHGLNFMTDAGVFSKGELDTGTRLLLDALPDVYGDVLDLGCGWGAIGVAVKKKYPAAHVTMVDVNRRALELCQAGHLPHVRRRGIAAQSRRRAVSGHPQAAGRGKLYEVPQNAVCQGR